MAPKYPQHISAECTVPCNLCERTDVEVIATRGRDEKPLRTVICIHCGLVWTDPRPSSESTRRFYTDEYRLAYKATYTPKRKHVIHETLRGLKRAEDIDDILQPDMRLLDAGCGGGFFLYALNRRGVQVSEIEPNNGFGSFATTELGLPVKSGFVQDVTFPKESFGIITLHHVLEHLEDPVGILRRLCGRLKPNGFLVIEVPNVEATYHAPHNRFHISHNYNFNPATLEGIGSRAGLSVFRSRLIPRTKHIHTTFQKRANAGGVESVANIPQN